MVGLPNAENVYFPDVRIVERERLGRGGTAVVTAEVALAEPLEVPFLEPETQGFLEIIESRPERRVITVLEILSPSNKYAGRGQELYLGKQSDLADREISLVEIDLLRAGPHVLQLPLRQYPPTHRTPYKVCVHRGWKASAEIYRVPLRERLPVIRVPFAKRTPMCRWTCKPSSPRCTATAATTTSITPFPPCRRWKLPMPPGPTNYCASGSRPAPPVPETT